MYMSGPPSQFGALGKRIRYSRSGGSYRRGKTSSHFFMGDVAPPFKAPPGTKWVYEVDGLSGLGKFRLKKVLSKVVNVVKKVAVAPFKAIYSVSKKLYDSPIGKAALLVGGAVYALPLITSSPWFQTLAAKIGTNAATLLAQKHAPSGTLTADEAARAENEISSNILPDWIAGPAQAYIASQTAGQAQAEAAQRANQIALQRQRDAEAAARAENEVSPQARQVASQVANETPAWVIPAAIGGAALLLMTTLS